MNATPSDWWSLEPHASLASLRSRESGLDAAEAAERLARSGPNEVLTSAPASAALLLRRQFTSPLVLILSAGASLSLLLRDWIDATTILLIVARSAGLGFWQELRASAAVTQLRSRLALTARVRRANAAATTLAVRDLVPGDVIELAAGNLVPADGLLLEARDFLVNQATLTGESLPVEKQPGAVAADATLAERHNAVFLGSSVRSGSATVLVVHTGRDTVLADVAARIASRDEETEFERGVRRFGELLMRVMVLVVVAVLVANHWLGRPVIESLLFAVALAVGLSPELLPAIVSVSLARGARRLAASGVLVRRLDAIEDLGGIDLLCTDKTGTLTVGTMTLEQSLDAQGAAGDEVMQMGYLNAAFDTGIDNPIDSAIVEAGRRRGLDSRGWRKVDEIAYDFTRKRLTIVVADEAAGAQPLLISKGAVAQVLDACALEPEERARLEALAREHGERGIRAVALAHQRMPAKARYTAADDDRRADRRTAQRGAVAPGRAHPAVRRGRSGGQGAHRARLAAHRSRRRLPRRRHQRRARAARS